MALTFQSHGGGIYDGVVRHLKSRTLNSPLHLRVYQENHGTIPRVGTKHGHIRELLTENMKNKILDFPEITPEPRTYLTQY